MNFISSLLPSKEIYEFDDLNNEIAKVEEELGKCSEEISLFFDNVQRDIEEQCERNESHINHTNEIKTELLKSEKTLTDILHADLKTAKENFDSLVDEVNEITSSISFVHIVCEIHERLEMLKEFCSHSTDYLQIVEVINVLYMLDNTLPRSPIIPFIVNLRDIINKEIGNANSLLTKEFHRNCNFIKETNTYMMRVPSENLKILHSILAALYKNEATRELLTTLPNLIWENLLSPMIEYWCEISELQKKEFLCIQVIIRKNKENKYEEVYKKISTLVDYLTKYFECEIDHDLKLLYFIGVLLREQLSKAILQNCILKEIPKDWKDIPQFKANLIMSTEKLEKKLNPHGFIDGHWDWVDGIEQFYAEKKCKYYSDKAKELMKKDLHNMIEVGTPYDSKKSLLETDEVLCCSISSYIPDLIKLGNELINEISEGPAENCGVLFNTYKGIFFNYGDFVASYHQKLLETIPQQVALFYNNCIYLYKQLQKWDETFENHDVINEFHDDSCKAFYQVEEVGRIFFDSFVREQKEQIQIILKGTNLQSKKTLENLEENTEKLFRQCLRQQELLKTVWSKVLSYPIYNRTIGDILNTMCNFLINSLVVLEDIGAVVAENLIELFKIVLNRGVKLFTDPNEVFLYVPQWHKFNELIFVLGASLLDISDRWADGKGPLALQFTPYELKQLIRALFQNSDRRDAVLSRIHE
ncbi:centromere/kinetochore protein zw10 homolog [Harmonia axyridis]|uniref:centromere/kinetochore protein zw10 homolog n=1 Tax=Harmonia axyridis TaxID=115357 RepID=UPI001E279CF9|nr:centromere/kinetochore protein zw10 homolog [Harmonia axyridis]